MHRKQKKITGRGTDTSLIGAQETYNYLMAWVHRLEPDPGAAMLERLQGAVGSEQLSREVDRLNQRLFKKTTAHDTQAPWRGEVLYRELASWRKKHMKTKETSLPGDTILAPLNPH